MSTLILLACHSVFTAGAERKASTTRLGPNEEGPGFKQDDWILAPFQYEANDHLSFVEHIHKGIELLEQNPKSILVISGGYTKKGIKLSESESYLQVARLRGLVTPENQDRIILEEYARDSYENLLLALALFRKTTGNFPEKVQIVSFEFKRYRFSELHAKALKLTNSEFIGVGPTYPSAQQLNLSDGEWEAKKKAYFEDLYFSEKKFATDLFEKDWFGCIGSKLYDKKVSRDVLGRGIGQEFYHQETEPVLNTLLTLDEHPFAEAKEIYDKLGAFPW